METIATTCHSLDRFYHINGDTFERQYKEVLSGYRQWRELSHADEWLIFPENVGKRLCIDETSMSNGELYTIVTNPERNAGRGTLVAIIEGVASENIIKTLQLIPEDKRNIVEEVTMDLSNSMHLIVRRCFRNAKRTIDRFHVQKLAYDALQEMRIAHRWDAIQADTDAREEAKIAGVEYKPEIMDNGDTRKQLLARSRHLLFKSPDKWTPAQKKRAGILFMLYPDIKEAYSLSHSLRMIYMERMAFGKALDCEPEALGRTIFFQCL